MSKTQSSSSHYQERVRTFCIIAHIDHGKSTLADRFLQKASLVSDRDFHSQMLDSMEIEQERGITIKSQAVTLPYTSKEGKEYLFNLVDTPGHVDFSYEVSRAIASCEGALLLIDATQGVEAQTIANMYMAMEHNLTILPVANKMDLPSADIERVREQVEHDLGINSDLLYPLSAKTGEGIDVLLEGIVKHIPPPPGKQEDPLRALIFDSHYDPYRGVVVHLRLFSGTLETDQKILVFSKDKSYITEEVGIFQLGLHKTGRLVAGEVGYLLAGIKDISDIRVGETVTAADAPCQEPLPGYREVKPVVFSSVYPIDNGLYEELKGSIEKLKLNDAALVYEKDSSVALGFGFRCGFLGLLHLEVVQERLEREFKLNIVLTAPSVRYRITPQKGEPFFLDNPSDFPDLGTIEKTEEPFIRASIITPTEFLGNIMSLCTGKRGIQNSLDYLDASRVELRYEMPLAEILFDFADKLKSVSKGYASFDYEMIGYQNSNLVKLQILVNGDPVDALSQIVFKDNAYPRGRAICKRLKDEIPRQQFKIPIQASSGGSIIARETISALRKNVIAKCYGGDITRKRKLLEKQKEGKKKMKMVGNVALPQSAFLAVLKSDQDS